MLFTIDKEPIKYIPHKQQYDIWRNNLSQEEFEAIVQALNERINTDEVHTAGWIPGSEWEGTVFYPIYEKACLGDVDAAGKCFGLIMWEIMMNRPEAWAFGRYEKDGIPIQSLTYFKIVV